MAGTTWSVRIDEEVKKEITELLNSDGGNGEEFVKSLLSSYKLKQAEELQPIATQDIKDLQIHLSAVQDIYYNISKRVDLRLKAKDQEVSEILTEKTDEFEKILTTNAAEFEKATERIAELEAALRTSSEENENNIKVIESQSKKIIDLEDAVTTTKELVAEYKEKNDTLTGLLAEYKGYKSEIEETKKSLSDEREIKGTLEKEKKEALEVFEKSKVQYQEDIGKLNANHADEIQRIKNNLDMDHKQKLLDVQAVHQDELNKLHKDYNDQIQKMLLTFNHKDDEPKRTKTKTPADTAAKSTK